MPPLKKGPLAGLKGKAKSTPKADGPLWQGPEAQGPLGGITFSMLSKWLTCRERFRVRYVEGWEPTRQFSHRIEYGNMWHVCEEALAGLSIVQSNWVDVRGGDTWQANLYAYVKELRQRFPLDQEQIVHWYNVCKIQFPVYVEYWSKHPDVVNRTPLLQEQTFDVPYTLPSGRVVRLRGKWDSVDLIGQGKNAGVYLQENKTKGDIDELALQRQLTFDLQTMMYLVALHAEMEGEEQTPLTELRKSRGYDAPIRGVRYNVVRRPLSGGEGTIVQKKGSKNVAPETDEAFYARVRGVIDGTGVKTDGTNYTGPSHWFMRWKFDVTPQDVKRFRDECLDPILEALCNWCHLTTGKPLTAFDQGCLQFGHHWRHPFGCDNAVNEYGATDVDEYLNTGNTVGMHKRETLFEELQ